MLDLLVKIPYLRLKYKFLPNRAQRFWGQELLNSQGISAKIGQVLGQGQKTELPKSTITPLAAKKIFETSFPAPVTFQAEVLAASMGQVFKVEFEGSTHALKILHPGLKEKMGKEIENLLLLGGYFAKAKGFHFDQGTFKRFLTEVFEEETDLKREAQFQQKFELLFSGDERFQIPKVNREFSNENMLTQEWVRADLARDLTHFPHFDVFTFFFKSLLQKGILHGDLNDRNWGISPAGAVVIYDFGCSQIVSERRINGFKKLILNKDIITAFGEFGIRLDSTWFKGKEQELRDALFAPFSASVVKPDWSYSQTLEERFGDKVKSLREVSDPWILLMLRSLFSLIRVYHDRGISIPLRDLMAPFVDLKEDHDPKLQLHVEISQKDVRSFYLPLPLSYLDNLSSHIPLKVKEWVDVDGIVKKVNKEGKHAQELFDVVVEGRRHRVWIG